MPPGTDVIRIDAGALPATLDPHQHTAGISLATYFQPANGLSWIDEAGLLQPPQPTWGSMLGDARSYLSTAWWTGVFPGVAIVATASSVNVIGERPREVLDPRLRGL